MGAHKLPLGKRLLAGVSAFTMASLAIVGAGAAHAATTDEPTNGNIDFAAEGSITVHKHVQPDPQGAPASGAEQDVTTAALEGIEFSLERITSIDLSDADQWDQLENLTPGDLDEDDLEAVAGPVETDASGEVLFDGLPVGVYLVTEGADYGGHNVVRTVEPFLVMIPMDIAGTWTYDVHVYPKNSLTEVSKELDAETEATAAGAGDPVVWNISAVVPTLAEADTFTELRYVDELDSRLSYVDVTDVQLAGTALDEADYTVTVVDQVVTIELTSAGLVKAKAANTGAALTYTINTVVSADADTIGDGAIENVVTQYTRINDEEFDFTTPEATANWGVLQILKQDADTEQALEGAAFQVFGSEADALAGEPAISINGESTFTTQADGTLNIGPLNAGAENSREYFLVETAAPAGYQLDATPRSFFITAGISTEVLVIDNEKQPDFELPLTGAAGTGVFMLIGLALLAVGGGLYARNRKANA